ncbi:hypothetical protein PAECIP111893_02430 [Paenibacillus plantiphilus]|uniref:KilA-N DNA-binding domain-containing protein n=1 Tax=Paenibacillus plantiphilus TaxID=2905650 RepID=A0ABN8GCT7_9BACL|nr:ORF6N domain-containing protein [Paenibacillus plantiphilus]CAH1205823.1 hypothetical protein PAECIP111893_02430 [Paenibacillus plantiphilus]
MNQIKVIERSGMRVLTTPQLAESFGTDSGKINYNFSYNKKRYVEGVHYFVLTGDELRDFKTECEIHISLKRVNTLYLWTEKGAFLHAKSLNTDQAWNAYSQLVDDYFKKVEQLKEAQQPQQDHSGLSPLLQTLIHIETRQNAVEAKFNAYEAQLAEKSTAIDEVKDAVATISDNMTAVPDHTKVVSTVNEYARWTRLGHNEVYNKLYDALKSAHGIDVRQRVENERARIQEDYNNKTGKWYSESTLKQKVNGITVMVRLGCLDKFNTILVGLLAKEKAKSNLRLVQ